MPLMPISQVVNAGQAATVATTVAGLGAASTGKQGLIRAGASPYDFVALIYDSSYGKWVGQAMAMPGPTGWNASSLSYQDAALPTSMNEALVPWRVLDTAGLAPQYRIQGLTSTDGVNAVFGALLVYAADANGALASQGSEFAIVTSATTAIVLDSGWTALPGGLTVKDFLGVRRRVKQASAGSGSLSQITMSMRWVSA